MNYSELVQYIAEKTTAQVDKMIKKEVNSDKTFTAQITETVNATTCRVLYCGNTFTVSNIMQCDAGDVVRVCAPCNNWTDLFVVENKTKRTR
ncbi:hypothetical protein [Clostridium transplantifaecale]|uniref:hypothetical protein n=1 Tax=Clostridium transplantifaecale TaxID=2479838 RepID=UPI000F6376B2|nr:hypothetical protein [Clostridium transplantifaecale]